MGCKKGGTKTASLVVTKTTQSRTDCPTKLIQFIVKIKTTMENNSENLKALGLKIEALSQAVGGLSPDGKNQQMGGYTFISSSQMLSALRAKLLAAKLSIIPSVTSYEERDYESLDKDGNARTAIRTVVVMNFRIIDLETGYHTDEQFVGAEQDYGGKSMQQAITQANKYFLFKLLKTSAENDDNDSNSVQTSRRSDVGAGGGGKSALSETRADGTEKPWLDKDKLPDKWKEVALWISKGGDAKRVRDNWKISGKSLTELQADANKLVTH